MCRSPTCSRRRGGHGRGALSASRRPAGLPLSALDAARQAFDTPPDDARVMMRWWWFGPATTEAQIARDLEAMKRAGLGGAEIQPVYPLALDDPARGVVNMRFLSDEFLGRCCGWPTQRAAALGLRLDLTLGSGWPYGGPTVGITDAASRLRLDRIVVGPGAPRVARPAMTTGETWIGAFVGPDGDTRVTPASMRPLAWPDAADAVTLPDGPAHAAGVVLHRRSDRDAGEAPGHRRRRLRPEPLRPRRAGPLSRPGGRAAAERRLPDACRSRSSATASRSTTRTGRPTSPSEFATRRGYDVAPLLPVLAADRGAEGAMVREDWGRTLTELARRAVHRPAAASGRAHAARGCASRATASRRPPCRAMPPRICRKARGTSGASSPRRGGPRRPATCSTSPWRAARRGRGCTRRRFARRRSTSRPKPTATSCRASRSSSATGGRPRRRARPIRAGVSTPPASSTIATRGGLRCRTCRATCSA